MAGVAETESFDKAAGALIIFSRSHPDRVAVSLTCDPQHLIHDHGAVAATAMIGMHDDLRPNQMQVVAGRHVHCEHSYWASRILRYVEIVLCGLEVPPVPHLPGQHFRDYWECVGVVDLPRRLLNAGDCGYLS